MGNRFRLYFETSGIPSALVMANGDVAEANEPFCEMIGHSEQEVRDGQLNWKHISTSDSSTRDSEFFAEVHLTGLGKPYEKDFVGPYGFRIPAIVTGARFGDPGDGTVLLALGLSSIRENEGMLSLIRGRLSFLSKSLSDLQDELASRLRAHDSLITHSAEMNTLSSALAEAERRERDELMLLLHQGLRRLFVGDRFRDALAVWLRKVRHSIDSTTDLITEGIESSRELSRDLSLTLLQRGRLISTLEWFAETMNARYRLHVDLALNENIELASDDVKFVVLRAVRELLMNTIRHSDVMAARVSAVVLDKSIEIEVEDDGIGFDPLEMSTPTHKSGGLARTTERIRMMDGQLQIFSAPGLGARIRILLPRWARVCRSRNVATPAPALPAKHADPTSIHILLVDDHPVIRKGLTLLLEGQPDLDVIGEASDGETAVELTRAVKPDVVLMDVSMPGMGGVEATKRIHRELPGVRVIGLSMLEEPETSHLMQDAGAVSYLAKNASPEALISAIHKSL